MDTLKYCYLMNYNKNDGCYNIYFCLNLLNTECVFTQKAELIHNLASFYEKKQKNIEKK